MLIENTHHKLSWRYIANINSLKSVFSENNISLPYIAEAHICYCGKQCIAIDYEPQEPYYECPDCGNVMFLDANYYAGNSAFYEPILEIFSVDELKNLDFKIKYNKANKTIHAALIVPIPNGIDLVTNTILYNEKKLFELDITRNQFTEKKFVNFKTIDDSDDEYLLLDEPIKEHEIISFYKNNFMDKIISSNFFPKITSMLKQCSNIKEAMFFLNNQQLQSIEFLKWRNVEILPTKENLSVEQALNFLLCNRKEKSVKKAFMENHKYQISNNHQYDTIFVYLIAKYIMDPNIASRMMSLNYSMIYEHNALECEDIEIFFEFLCSRYSYVQIEKLFQSYIDINEDFWLTHTINLFVELGSEERKNFQKVPSGVEALHNEISIFHRTVMFDKLLIEEFRYSSAQLNACNNISSYSVRLPMTGKELFRWSIALENCLAGYGKKIASGKTIVYGFFENDEIKFAVEIQNKQIVQANLKYNQSLDSRDVNVVNSWHQQYVYSTYENITIK